MKPPVINYADYEALKAENEALKMELKAYMECDSCKYANLPENAEPCKECIDNTQEWKMWEWRGVSNDRT